MTAGSGYGAGRRGQPGTRAQRGAVQVDPHPAGVRDVAQVGEQAVADIDHRGGAQAGRLRAGLVRRRGPQVLPHQGIAGHALLQQGQAGRGVAERARRRDQIAGPGPGAEHRAAPAQVAEAGYGEHHLVGAGGVAADHVGASPGALGGQPFGQLAGPADRQVRRRGQRHQQGRRLGAHGRAVGQAARRGLVPDVRRAGPVPAEVPALDQEVRGGHHPAVRDGQHGRVVADADQRRRAGRKPRRQRRDQAELPGLR
jgi:hypothetical protein